MKTPANPENVPLDKIPAGWRLIYEEEYGKPIPTRLWNVEQKIGKKAVFYHSVEMASNHSRRDTYITPDLPDNGQPWHAHKPGDPAPVEDVQVDIVCKNGCAQARFFNPSWDDIGGASILFYRLHDPAAVKTESPTFEAHGHTWFRHTPGDPMPCEKCAKVYVVMANGVPEEYPYDAAGWAWSTSPQENRRIIGWRYANQPVAEPSIPPTSDRILSILIAAGHITEEQVEQARKLAKD